MSSCLFVDQNDKNDIKVITFILSSYVLILVMKSIFTNAVCCLILLNANYVIQTQYLKTDFTYINMTRSGMVFYTFLTFIWCSQVWYFARKMLVLNILLIHRKRCFVWVLFQELGHGFFHVRWTYNSFRSLLLYLLATF